MERRVQIPLWFATVTVKYSLSAIRDIKVFDELDKIVEHTWIQ